MSAPRTAIGAAIVGAMFLAAAPAATAQQSTDIPLTIRTVPRLEGVRIYLNESLFKTDDQGVATIAVPEAGTYRLRVGSPTLLGERRRAEFVQWSDGVEGRDRQISVTAPAELTAGFNLSYIVSEEIFDADGNAVSADLLDSLTVTDDLGNSRTYSASTHGLAGPTALVWQRHPPGTRWLLGRRLVLSAGDMISGVVAYSVDHAAAGGDALEATSTPFYPARAEKWTIDLKAFRVTLATTGLLARPPSSARLAVVYPDGHALAPQGRTVVLGPGRYRATVDTTGLVLGSGFSLPGPTRVEVVVIGIRELIGVVLALAALAAAAVVLWRARRRRAGPPRLPKPALEVPVATASAPVPREAKEFVRIVLDSGRTIEGWVDAPGEPGRVMILDVFRVRDAGGREIVASPSDSFVLTAHIESFERLDGRSPELEANGRAGPAGAPKADGSPRDLAGSNESSGPSGNGRPLTM